MSQYNQNSICFIGSEDDIKVILLAMSRNQEKSAARLVEDGLRDEEVASLVGISNRVVKKTTIWDMYEECRDNLWNPVYMLDPCPMSGLVGMRAAATRQWFIGK